MRINHYYGGIQKNESNTIDDNPIVIYWATDSHTYALVDGNPAHENAISYNRYYYTSSQKLQNFVDDVNVSGADLAFFSGDMVEWWDGTSPQLFMSKWEQISIKKGLTLGNHDLGGGGAVNVANTDMADMYGYGDNPIIAGSKYNYSFYLDNGHNRVKVISFDTNLDDNGEHIITTVQTVKQPVLDWLQSEILNSDTDSVILFSHASPADWDIHFNPTDRENFKTMINNVVAQRPAVNIVSLAGHNHVQGIQEWDNLGLSNIRFITTPPVVDFVTGKYTIVTFSSITGVDFTEKDLRYPYP